MFTYMLLGIFALFLLLFLIHTFPPTYTFSFWNLSLPILPVFFLLVFLLFFGLVTFALRNVAQGMLAGSVVTMYLLLRFFGVTHWFFLLLLVGLFATLEVFLLKAK